MDDPEAKARVEPPAGTGTSAAPDTDGSGGGEPHAGKPLFKTRWGNHYAPGETLLQMSRNIVRRSPARALHNAQMIMEAQRAASTAAAKGTAKGPAARKGAESSRKSQGGCRTKPWWALTSSSESEEESSAAGGASSASRSRQEQGQQVEVDVSVSDLADKIRGARPKLEAILRRRTLEEVDTMTPAQIRVLLAKELHVEAAALDEKEHKAEINTWLHDIHDAMRRDAGVGNTLVHEEVPPEGLKRPRREPGPTSLRQG